MPAATLRQLLEAGVHFGHQTSRWNPRMRPYIFTARNGIHIIDLEQTQKQPDIACEYLRDLVRTVQKVLFVGTKKQAQAGIEEACRSPRPARATPRAPQEEIALVVAGGGDIVCRGTEAPDHDGILAFRKQAGDDLATIEKVCLVHLVKTFAPISR